MSQQGPRYLSPIICARCSQSLTKGYWDKRTEQLYCRECLPPLPPSVDLAAQRAKKRLHGIPDIETLLSWCSWGHRDNVRLHEER